MNTFNVGAGPTRLTFAWRWWGHDLHVHIGGGDHHIGAAALVGRQSDGQTYDGMIRVPPHKEDAVVRKAAQALHSATGATVCVTAGIHLDNITSRQIDAVLTTVDLGVARLARTLGH